MLLCNVCKGFPTIERSIGMCQYWIPLCNFEIFCSLKGAAMQINLFDIITVF